MDESADDFVWPEKVFAPRQRNFSVMLWVLHDEGDIVSEEGGATPILRTRMAKRGAHVSNGYLGKLLTEVDADNPDALVGRWVKREMGSRKTYSISLAVDPFEMDSFPPCPWSGQGMRTSPEPKRERPPEPEPQPTLLSPPPPPERVETVNVGPVTVREAEPASEPDDQLSQNGAMTSTDLDLVEEPASAAPTIDKLLMIISVLHEVLGDVSEMSLRQLREAADAVAHVQVPEIERLVRERDEAVRQRDQALQQLAEAQRAYRSLQASRR